MKTPVHTFQVVAAALLLLISIAACDSTSVEEDDLPVVTLHPAFAAFDSLNVTVVLDSTNVIVESNGLPNHTSPYWSPTHPLIYHDARLIEY